MLHQTHHSSLFHLYPLPSISPPNLLPPSFPIVQGQEAEMERALKKSNLRPEACLKAATHATAPQEFYEEFWTDTVPAGVSVDEFFVDELLDFSHGGVGGGREEDDEEEAEEGQREDEGGKASVAASVSHEATENCNSNPNDGFGALPHSELGVPAEDMANLEWLSRFVEESFSEHSLAYPPAPPAAALALCTTGGAEERASKPCFNAPFPARARSKRPRNGGRAWSSSHAPSGATDSSISSSSSSTSSSPASFVYAQIGHQNADSWILEPWAEKPPAGKKQRKGPASEAGGALGAPRRCSHCGVQKTPQWRAGPLGAKTLCNACGVRFKSGRLLPEYRPACSPTFSSDLHSNSHRKVLEMRRKKEDVTESAPGLAPAVQSF